MLLTLLWCLAFVAVIVAGAAWWQARATAKAFARLAESYWELRYEHGQLASRLHLVEAQQGGRPSPDDVNGSAAVQASFIPLASLKKMS